MCQDKDHGGQRCEVSRTARAAHKLRQRLRNAEKRGETSTANEEALERLLAAREIYGPVVTPMTIPLPTGVKKVLNNIRAHGYSPLLVGGTVRDAAVDDRAPKDFDIEVYGVDIDTLATSLRQDGLIVDEVGKSFGVLKIHNNSGDDLDISVPRKDSLAGDAHTDFIVDMDENMSVNDASNRRDYTINSMMYDDKLEVLVDPQNGYQDLKSKTLRHVSDAFDEDVLRPLRGFQFAGRFGMTMDPETSAFCKTLAGKSNLIAKERIATEWEKFYLKTTEPDRSMKALRDMGWNNHAPGLEDVNKEDGSLDKLMTATYAVTVQDKLDGNHRVALYSSVIADSMPEDVGRSFFKTTVISHDLQRSGRVLTSTKIDENSDAYRLRRTAQELAVAKVSIRDWARKEAIVGRGKSAAKVLAHAEKLNIADENEKGFLLGRHLLELTDRQPGRWMSMIIDEAEERQFQGELRDLPSAIEWAKQEVSKLD